MQDLLINQTLANIFSRELTSSFHDIIQILQYVQVITIFFLISQVLFSFKLGWRYNQGPGCTPSVIGSLVTGMSSSFWKCTSGCSSTSQDLSNVNYICTGASTTEDWEQGERTFTYTFPGEGPFHVE
jgi:hypothetical protein